MPSFVICFDNPNVSWHSSVTKTFAKQAAVIQEQEIALQQLYSKIAPEDDETPESYEAAIAAATADADRTKMREERSESKKRPVPGTPKRGKVKRRSSQRSQQLPPI